MSDSVNEINLVPVSPQSIKVCHQEGQGLLVIQRLMSALAQRITYYCSESSEDGFHSLEVR